jgi:hypothetical protein
MGSLLSFLGYIVLIVAETCYCGFALKVLWKWFVVPTFNLPVLSLAPAIGLAMVVGYLTKQSHWPTAEELEKSNSERALEGTLMAIIKPSFALLFGWVVHQFM